MGIIRCGNGDALQGSDLPRVTPLSKWQSSSLTQAVCSSISLSVRTHYSQLCPQAGPRGGTLTFLTFSQSSACSDARMSLFLKLSGDASPGNILTRTGGVELSDRLMCTVPGNTEQVTWLGDKTNLRGRIPDNLCKYAATLSVEHDSVPWVWSEPSDLLPKMTVRRKETKGNSGDIPWGPVDKTPCFQVHLWSGN